MFDPVFCFQVTAASKFLTLQESVRDPADLYLSFKHYPLLFINYVTPHVVLSDIWTAGILKQQGTCGVLLEAV